MPNKELIIINNEKISIDSQGFCCDNVDIKTVPEGLNQIFNTTLIARNSKIKRTTSINLEKIYLSSNIFSFLYSILKTFKKKDAKYLIISITPYTFFSYILLFFFRKKIFVYLRSNGYEEYKAIFGFVGFVIYFIMFHIVTFKSIIIKCQERLFKKRKSEMVFPSELNSQWLENLKKPLLDKPRLLYIGRMKVEKGIFSFLKILNEINSDINFSIVGKKEDKKLFSEKIKFVGYGHAPSELIEIYDSHNIFILPSFTEAHPKVIDESLARNRPIIIFEEIKHIVKNKKGIFVAKRNAKSLLETIDFIMKNYSHIQDSIRKNSLPTKEKFISDMAHILKSN